VWRVYLCALLLVLNHAILKTKARAEEGERWAHPLGGLSFPEELKRTFKYCDMPSRFRSRKPSLSRLSGLKINVCAYTL
jgi:hypothetical protein